MSELPSTDMTSLNSSVVTSKVGPRCISLDGRQKVMIWMEQGVDNNIMLPAEGILNNSKHWLTSNVKTYHNTVCDTTYNGCHDDHIKSLQVFHCQKPVDLCPGNSSPEDQTDKIRDKLNVVEPVQNTGVPVDIGLNTYNSLNREIHQCLWCPCLLYFVFFFCLPAVYFMERSDSSFCKGDNKKSRRFALLAIVCYIVGFLITITFYTIIGWYVCVKL